MQFESISTSCLNDNDLPWVPFTPYDERVQLKYFKIDPVQGEIVAMLRAPEGIELARHHHTGTVIVYTVKGAWKYREHNWIARPGSLVYETASTRHTPEALRGEGDVLALNIIKGELVYLDDKDNVLAVENWRTSMDRYLAYCAANKIEPRDLTSFSD